MLVTAAERPAAPYVEAAAASLAGGVFPGRWAKGTPRRPSGRDPVAASARLAKGSPSLLRVTISSRQDHLDEGKMGPMHRARRYLRRRGGLSIVGGLTIFVIAMVISAITADDATLDRWAAIAQIASFPITIWGVAQALADGTPKPAQNLADELNRQVLKDAGDRLNELLRAGRDRARPAEVAYRGTDGSTYNQIDDFFLSAGRYPRTILLGDAGGGKTVALLTLTCAMAASRRALRDEGARGKTPVPVRFDLSRWDTSLGLQQWLRNSLLEQYREIDNRDADILLDEGMILPILDGLDEMDGSGVEPVRARAALKQMNTYTDGTNLRGLVVACREPEYRKLRDVLEDAKEVHILPLRRKQISTHISDELRRDNEPDRLTAWKKFEGKAAPPRLWELLGAPWLLTLFVIYLRDGAPIESLVQGHAEPEEHYVERVQEMLLERYVPARARAAPGEEYAPDLVHNWITAVANNLSEGSSDIEIPELWRIGGDLLVRAVHGCVAAIGASVLAVLAGLFWVRAKAYADPPLARLELFMCAAAAVALLGLGYLRFRQSISRETPSSGAVLTVRNLQGRGRRSKLLRDVRVEVARGMREMFAIFAGAAILMSLGSYLAWGGGFAEALFAGLAFAFIVVAWWGLSALYDALFFARSDALHEVVPMARIKSDIFRLVGPGVVLGIPFAVATGIYGWSAGRPWAGLVGGLLAATLIGLLSCYIAWMFGYGQLWVRYVLGAVVSGLRGKLPFRADRFLSWCVDCEILRRSGPYYQLRHITLRDHLRKR